jgi:hypothetical protein
MDATITLREILRLSNVHDYETQTKGQEFKEKVKAAIWSNEDGFVDTYATLYRPETKNGDPRLWFYNLKKFTSPNVAILIIPINKKLHVINLATFDIKYSSTNKFFQIYSASENTPAEELLNKIREISKDWVKSIRKGDCSIGDTLESLLGIKQNSSKGADYKGIELKSKRSKSLTRNNLFAQVPDWEISKLKSSKQILDSYGYKDNKTRTKKLYVTVSAKRPNPQGLQLRVNFKKKCLEELYISKGKEICIVCWRFETLFERLLSKHKETFWVKAESEISKNKEYLLYTEIIHTKRPIIESFLKLIQEGGITLDHLIKEKGKSVVEKGPIFKIQPRFANRLFPSPVYYTLVEDDFVLKKVKELKDGLIKA